MVWFDAVSEINDVMQREEDANCNNTSLEDDPVADMCVPFGCMIHVVEFDLSLGLCCFRFAHVMLLVICFGLFCLFLVFLISVLFVSCLCIVSVFVLSF